MADQFVVEAREFETTIPPRTDGTVIRVQVYDRHAVKVVMPDMRDLIAAAREAVAASEALDARQTLNSRRWRDAILNLRRELDA